MLNSLKEELTHACNHFILRHLTFLSVIYVSKHIPRALCQLSLMAPGVAWSFYQLDPGTHDTAIFEPYYIQNAFPL